MAKRKQSKPNNDPKAANRRRRKRRRRGRYTLYYLLAVFFALAIGTILSLTVFFNIETILVTGNTKYADSSLVGSSGIGLGNNLFRIDSQSARELLRSGFPYIEDVTVRRALPATAVIEVTEAIPIGVFLQDGGGYLLISNKGRVLEVSFGQPPPTLLQVRGVELTGLQPCEYLDESYSESFQMFLRLDAAVKQTGFDHITDIDLSDRLNMRMVYDDRVRIELGSEADLDEKLDFAKYALENSVDLNFEGVMDVTIADQVRYRKQEIHPEGYHGEETLAPTDVSSGVDAEEKIENIPTE